MTGVASELQVSDLAGMRGGVAVFEGVSFTLRSSGLMSVRGPNGSGKSSLLRILGGLAAPSRGEIRWCEGGQADDQALSRVSHLVGHRGGITEAMSAHENLAFHTALLGGDARVVASALERVGLTPLSRARAYVLSAGQRKRLALARLITVRRPLWLLDEPTESLDAAGETLVSALIEEHRAQRGLVVVATHGAAPGAADLELALIPPQRAAA